MTDRPAPVPRHDRAEVVRALRLYLAVSGLTEIRALAATLTPGGRPSTLSGYCDDAEAGADMVGQVRTAAGIYFVPNRIHPGLLARAVNRIRPVWKEPTTADGDVVRRLWFLVDCDPVRPSGISATDDEHVLALQRADLVRRDLALRGFYAPVYADSANGGHLSYRVDLPADDGGLLRRCLDGLSDRYSDGRVKVDTAVHTAARLWKLPGTRGCKGDDAGDACGRPHRAARLLDVPPVLTVCPAALLEELADELKPVVTAAAAAPTGHAHNSGGGGGFDLDAWVRCHNLDVGAAAPWTPKAGGSGTRRVFDVCPFNPAHANRSAALLQFPSGAVEFTCRHDGCRGNDWHRLRDLCEPGWDRRRTGAPAPRPTPSAGAGAAGAGADADAGPAPGGGGGGGARAEVPDPPSVRQLMRLYPHLRPPVLHGLLRRGETMNVIAPSKTGKSWLVTDLAIALATGRSWLGRFATERGDVLVLDNELHGETTACRVPKVAAARGVLVDEFADHLFVENLRGRLRDVFSLAPYFDRLEPGRFKAIVLDAFYRFMPPDCDENDNATMAAVYSHLDRYADRLGCCFVLIHHSTKGSQAEKAVVDVGAGAGSQSRATDTHLVLRQHEDDGVVVLDAAVRSWPPLDPVCLRWQFPVWAPDPTLDPALLRRPGARQRRRDEERPDPAPDAPAAPWTTASFVAAVVTAEPKTEATILVAAEAAGLSERRAGRLLAAAVDAGLAHEWVYAQRRSPHRFATIPQPVTATGGGAA